LTDSRQTWFARIQLKSSLLILLLLSHSYGLSGRLSVVVTVVCLYVTNWS